ncbi:hypothetical protein C0995_006276 [Termitomyces sp. Mi166|nr:hypothetical protein C0995_006276 [Termitomyces sp. Mi166\
MAFNGKKYVEKAIQTLQIDKLASSPNSSQHHTQNLEGYRSNHDDKKTSTTYHSDEESAPVDAAYTDSESLCLSHNLESSSSSQSRSHRAPKPAQLPRNRPSRIQNQGKRVVSFPEVAALKSLSNNLSVPAYDGPLLRVVSLPGPELEGNSNLGSPVSTQDNLSSSVEYLDSSLDTSYHSSGTGSVHPDARGFPPSDMPTTPSPPSSPESVFVIGNESRVSQAFLRQCSISSNKTCDAEDEAGWITWASSPPRPIPALHGPLSLPYARCPSGAEGTIIEDADLPRMIWGLDLEDTAGASGKSPQPDTPIVDSQASGPSNQATYNSMRNPEPIHEHLDDKVLESKEIKRDLENTTIRAKSQPFVLVPEFQPRAMHEVFPDKPRVWDDTPIDIHKLTPYDASVRSKPGIDPLVHPKKIPESTSMSSAFISAPPRQWSSSSMTPRIFIEPLPGSQITAGPRLSAIEIAQRYRAERQQSTLPSLQPSSPTWSPTLPLDFPARPFSSSQSQLPDEHDFASSFDSRTHTRASNFSKRGIPTEARGQTELEVAHRELNNIINLPSTDYLSDPSFSSRMNTLASPETSFARRRSSAIDMSLILKRLPPPPPTTTITRPNSRSQDIPIPSSPNLLLQRSSAPQTRTRLLGPRMLSVPMTRLIQRRLSSVTEEDASFASSGSRTDLQSGRLNNNDSSDTPGIMDDVKVDGAVKSNIVERQDQGGPGGLYCENKENTTDSEKAVTVKKKWRSRKRVGVSCLKSSQKKNGSLD